MNDRELLELAAKAVGDSVRWYCGRLVRLNADGLDAGEWGNPLADDGDALRLAVRLGLCVSPFGQTDVTDPNGQICCVELHANDPLAATRRAIVRAAAEIGKAMP